MRGAVNAGRRTHDGPDRSRDPGRGAAGRSRYASRFSTASQFTFLKNASTYFARSVAR
jgi:hypothetical protein